MTKITQLKLNRIYEGKDKNGKAIKREKRIEIPRGKEIIDCGGGRIIEVFVSVGQIINKAKMCKRKFGGRVIKNRD